MSYAVTDIITWMKICQPLSYVGEMNRKAFNGDDTADENFHIKLYDVRKAIEWEYQQNPNSLYLYKLKDYGYALCFPYILRAMEISGSGGTVINPIIPSNTGFAFEYIRRITASDFTNGTDYISDWIAGYEVFVEWDNGNQRYLVPGEQIQYLPNGFRVFIDDGTGNNSFDARTTNADVIMIVLKRFPLGTPVPVTPEAPIIFSYNFTADDTVPNIDLSIYSEGQEIQVSVQANGHTVTWASQYEWSDNNPEQPSANVVGTYSLYTFMVIVDKLVCISQSLNIVI